MKTLMLITWLTGAVADEHTTCAGLMRGGREIVLTQSCAVNTAVITGEMVAGSYGLNKLYVRHPKLAAGIGIAAGAIRIGIAARNLRVQR